MMIKGHRKPYHLRNSFRGYVGLGGERQAQIFRTREHCNDALCALSPKYYYQGRYHHSAHLKPKAAANFTES